MEIKPNSHVLIIGCGYVGTHLAKSLLKKGFRVSGTTRSQERLPILNNIGIRPFLCDLNTAQGFAEFGKVDYIVLSPAPSKHFGDSYTSLYDTGISRLMTYLHFYPPKEKLIYTSSVGVYETQSGDWVDENSLLFPTTPRTKALISGENWVLKSSVPSIVARLGGIYGPERNRVRAVKENKNGVAEPQKFVNLIHIEDVTNCLEYLMRSGESKQIYNLVDGNPPLRLEMLKFIATKLGVELKNQNGEKQATSERLKQNKRCSNKKLVDLGYKFNYPSYKEGYQQILELLSKS